MHHNDSRGNSGELAPPPVDTVASGTPYPAQTSPQESPQDGIGPTWPESWPGSWFHMQWLLSEAREEAERARLYAAAWKAAAKRWREVAEDAWAELLDGDPEAS